MKLTFAVTPEVTVQGGAVWCEGEKVGEIASSLIDKGGEATLTVRIYDEKIKRTLREGILATLKHTIAELRRDHESYEGPTTPEQRERPHKRFRTSEIGWDEVPLDDSPAGAGP